MRRVSRQKREAPVKASWQQLTDLICSAAGGAGATTPSAADAPPDPDPIKTMAKLGLVGCDHTLSFCKWGGQARCGRTSSLRHWSVTRASHLVLTTCRCGRVRCTDSSFAVFITHTHPPGSVAVAACTWPRGGSSAQATELAPHLGLEGSHSPRPTQQIPPHSGAGCRRPAAMRRRPGLCATLAIASVALLLAAAPSSSAAPNFKRLSDERIVLQTQFGDLELALYPLVRRASMPDVHDIPETPARRASHPAPSYRYTHHVTHRHAPPPITPARPRLPPRATCTS